MRILITGSEGNIGSYLVPELIRNGHDVFGIDIRQGFRHNYRVCDITKPVDMTMVFDAFKPDVVYHLAAMVSRVTCELSPSLTVDTNISGTNNVIQMCKRYGAKMINFSTSEIYGNIGGLLKEDRPDINPNNIYGITKYMAEQLVKYEISNGLRAITVRPFMIYHENETFGINHSAMIRFAEGLLIGQKITVHKGASRSWIHMKDAVKVLSGLAQCQQDVTMNIGDDRVVDMEYIARYMCDMTGLKYESCVTEEDLPPRMTLTKIPDITTMRKVTGIIPEYDIESGIRLVVETAKTRLKR